jgi:glycosyltransferase involved in cell wall biosynthesis
MSDTPAPFSLLLPVYRGDKAEHFARAFSSAVVDQDRRPAEVVLVQDGPVGDALGTVIAHAKTTSPVVVHHLVMPTNVGLATALTRGLEACAHDIVARMDADDISLPERFARQVPLIEGGLDMVGTAMFEFDESGRVLGRRVPPTGQANIAHQAKFKDPFNHPTVVYRRSAVLAAGGYRHLDLMEDYWLFVRMLQRGARVENIVDPLVMYRVDAGAYNRRGGLRLFRSELALQRALRKDRFLSRAQFLRNVVLRGGYRFVPVGLRRVAYRRMAVSGNSEGDG